MVMRREMRDEPACFVFLKYSTTNDDDEKQSAIAVLGNFTVEYRAQINTDYQQQQQRIPFFPNSIQT